MNNKYLQKLFNYMKDEHDVTLLETDMFEIEDIVIRGYIESKIEENAEFCLKALWYLRGNEKSFKAYGKMFIDMMFVEKEEIK